MKATVHQELPPELVALIHHVELSESGWYDQLLDQLIISSLYLNPDACNHEGVRASLKSSFGFAVNEDTFRKSIRRLKKSNKLIEVNNQQFHLTDESMQETESKVADNSLLDERVASRFKALVVEHSSTLDPEDCWGSFCSDCLEPLIKKLGARTYELITVPTYSGPDVHSIVGCTDNYPPEMRTTIHAIMTDFLDPENQDVRNFILNRLHCHLLTLAVSLPEQSLSKLVSASKSNLQLKLFLDTNFLFSLLKLRDHPANSVATEMVQLLDEIRNYVHSKLYVFPPTIDEAHRTLRGFQRDLSDVEFTPRLGQIATRIPSGKGSGFRAQFLRKAATARHKLSAKTYLDPYLSDFVSVLRGFGLEIFNERVDPLFESNDVLDDINAEQEFQHDHYPMERQKRLEAIRHDVVLWHFAFKKRSVRVQSPLDAIYWVVTLDNNLVRFDREKLESQEVSRVPICVHPAILMQMLRLWVPRTQLFDTAMLHSVRSLLPQASETDVEGVILKILQSLSRFEGVDQLPEETISSVLLNRALRSGMVDATAPDQQNHLVRDALLDDLRSARHRVDEIQQRHDKELQKARNVADKLRHSQQLDRKNFDRLQSQLQDERMWRTKLESEVDDVKQERDVVRMERDNVRAEHAKLIQTTHRVVFSVLSLVALPVLYFLARLGGAFIAPDSQLFTETSGVVGGCVWAVLAEQIGRRIESTNSWSVFQYFVRKKKAIFGALGTLVIALLAKWIWEAW